MMQTELKHYLISHVVFQVAVPVFFPVSLPSPTCGRGAGGEGVHREMRILQRFSLSLALSHKWAMELLYFAANREALRSELKHLLEITR